MRTVKIGIAVVMHPAALWLHEGVAFTHFVASVLGW